MKSFIAMIIFLVSLFLTSCQEKIQCPPDTISYLSPPFSPEETEATSQPLEVKIGRQDILVDEVISGEVCNDSWLGVIYVTCDIQIPAWEEEALFFQDCDLTIEEGTIVYVEAHNNQPYYKGCSCHKFSEK
jgi:hypothetical protein